MALSDSAGIGSALPSQVGVTSGWGLVTDGTTASWAAISGGSGVTTVGTFSTTGITNGASISGVTITLGPADGTMPGLLKGLGSVGSTPAAAGASLGTDGTLTLQPADGTHPGVVTTAAQTFAGDKTIAGIVLTLASGPFTWKGVAVATNCGVFTPDNLGVVVMGAAGGNVTLSPQLGTAVVINPTFIDGTQMGDGGGIKLKSPDGTTYTATIANGGTWSIA